jgi:dUTP pyrophosphatase
MSELFISNELRIAKEKGFAILKIAISHETSDEFKIITTTAIQKHNQQVLTNAYPDSGVDLRIPENTVFETLYKTRFVNLGLRASMTHNDKPCAFLIHPRSSMSKLPLMLANHTGIIDSGYRGPLLAAFRLLPNENDNENLYTIEKHTRLVQICHPSLCPIYVIECCESELSETERGEGGFGSTGK